MANIGNCKPSFGALKNDKPKKMQAQKHKEAYDQIQNVLYL